MLIANKTVKNASRDFFDFSVWDWVFYCIDFCVRVSLRLACHGTSRLLRDRIGYIRGILILPGALRCTRL